MVKRVTDIDRGKVLHHRDLHGSSGRTLAGHFGHSSNTISAFLRGERRTDYVPLRITAKRDSVAYRRRLIRRLASQKRTRMGRTVLPFASSSRISAALRDLHGISASPATVRRDLVACNWRCYVRPKRSHDGKKKAKTARYKFACSSRWTHETLDRLVFSDESEFTTNDASCRQQWVPSGHRQSLVQRESMSKFNIPCVMVWGAIGIGWRSPLVRVEKKRDEDTQRVKRMDAERYIRVCLSKVVPQLLRHQSLFMQDGARCHTAKRVKEYLIRKGVSWIDDWPAYSPDMNPIESVWALLNRLRSQRFGTAQDADELFRQLKLVWDDIPQATLDAFVRSFDKKRKEVRANRGA